MRSKLFRRLLALAMIIALGILAYGGWWLLLDGRPPAKRPDLVRVPVDVVGPGMGYPTVHALYVGYVLGCVDVADLSEPPPPPEGVSVEPDLVYGKVGERELKLDVYRPTVAPSKPVPILLFIHGGGWSGGDRKDYAIYCNKFAKLGYVVSSMGYRFLSEAKFPAAVQDTNAAIRWLRTNAARFGGDPARIAVMGGSAGGHLSLMAAYASDVPEFQGDAGNPGVSSRVQAVVDLYGPVDLTKPVAQRAPQVTGFLGTTWEESPESFRRASPITYLDKDDPPTLIIQGTLDDTVPVAQSDQLAEALKGLGADYWYDRIDGWPHTLDIVWANFEHTSALIFEFLKAQGLGGKLRFPTPVRGNPGGGSPV